MISISNIIFCNSSNVNFLLPTTYFKHLLRKETSFSQKPSCQGALAKLKPQDKPFLEENACVSSAVNTFPLLDMTFLGHPRLAINVRKLFINVFA